MIKAHVYNRQIIIIRTRRYQFYRFQVMISRSPRPQYDNLYENDLLIDIYFHILRIVKIFIFLIKESEQKSKFG